MCVYAGVLPVNWNSPCFTLSPIWLTSRDNVRPSGGMAAALRQHSSTSDVDQQVVPSGLSSSPDTPRRRGQSVRRSLSISRTTRSSRPAVRRNPPTNRRADSRGGAKARAVNPFRQEDEEHVLSTRSHNRRRWSHVFPLGEEEFKRRSGPSWKSLCQPVALPLTIDYIPSQKELDNPNKFSFSFYQITLAALDHSHYGTYEDLLSEMVGQRITNDYQVVPRAVVQASNQLPKLKTRESRGKSAFAVVVFFGEVILSMTESFRCCCR